MIVHIVNKGICDIETLLQAIIEELLNKNKNEKWNKKLYENITEEVYFLSNTLKFKPSSNTIGVLRRHFATFLTQLSESAPEKSFIL